LPVSGRGALVERGKLQYDEHPLGVVPEAEVAWDAIGVTPLYHFCCNILMMHEPLERAGILRDGRPVETMQYAFYSPLFTAVWVDDGRPVKAMKFAAIPPLLPARRMKNVPVCHVLTIISYGGLRHCEKAVGFEVISRRWSWR